MSKEARDLSPHDLQVERDLLGVLLRDDSQVYDVAGRISHEDFYGHANGLIFQALVALKFHEGKQASPAIVATWLKDRGLVDDVGYPYLGEVFSSAPCSAKAEHYAEIVRSYAVRRSLILAGQEIASAAAAPGPAEDAMEVAEKAVFAVSQRGHANRTVKLAEAVDSAMVRIDQRQNREGFCGGVKTGWQSLDWLLVGLEDGALAIIAARPSVGKTAFAIALAYQVAEKEGPIFFASLEQSREELAERLLAAKSGVNSYQLKSGKLSEEDGGKLVDARQWLAGLPWFLDDSPGQSMLQIAASARRARIREKIKLVVIDYLQLIEPEDKRAPRQEQVSLISRRLKFLARELKIPVVCLAQVNREAEKRADGRPKLSDLRESGAIEQDADVVLLLHQEPGKEEEPTSNLEVIVAKNRNGMRGTAALSFQKATMRITDKGNDIPADHWAQKEVF